MSIWKTPISIDILNQRSANTMMEFLGIEFTEVGDDYLTAIMPATARTVQPLRIVHGGANVVLAETVGSSAANFCVDQNTHYAVGLEINANHLKPVPEGGVVTAIAKPIRLGRTIHVWHIDLFNEQGDITCISRHTCAVITR